LPIPLSATTQPVADTPRIMVRKRKQANRRRTPQTSQNTLQVKQRCPLSKWQGEEGACHWCSKPLTGRQRSWCSRQCCIEFERNHVWSIARRTTRRKAKYQCQTCGSKTKLEVNHITPVKGTGYRLSCNHHLSNLELLCHACHVQVTNQQREKQRKETSVRQPAGEAQTV